jgi:hypothetical protein
MIAPTLAATASQANQGVGPLSVYPDDCQGKSSYPEAQRKVEGHNRKTEQRHRSRRAEAQGDGEHHDLGNLGSDGD